VTFLVSCSKEEESTLELNQELIDQSVISFESLGEISVKLFKDPNDQLSKDYGVHQQEVEDFFNNNPEHVTMIDYKANGDYKVTILKDKNSALYPKEIPMTKPNEFVDAKSFNYEVTFYDDDNFRDRYLRIVKPFNHYDSDLKNTYSTSPRKKGFNDKTSSLIAKAPSNKRLRIRLYDDKNYQDTQIILTLDYNTSLYVTYFGITYYLNNNPGTTSNYIDNFGQYYIPRFNDKLSSFKLEVLN
jgi:hypothetical protein